MQAIINSLHLFDRITLKEIDKLKLMSRMDTKFMFKRERLPLILNDLVPYYRILHIESNVLSRYETLYYDTTNLMLYKSHHNGELNRYKIRHRYYVDSKVGFLEVKFKNNKGRTIKERIKQKKPVQTFDEGAFSFLEKKLPFNPNTLVPIVWVNYSRITLVNKINSEKVTIDLNLEFKKGEHQIKLENLVIVEVKQESRQQSPFMTTLKKFHLREEAISKYCFAVAFMYEDVKKNNFKEKLITLKQIMNYDFTPNIFRNNC